MTEKKYRELHEHLMEVLRGELRNRHLKSLERTGRRLHRLRRRYRREYAA